MELATKAKLELALSLVESATGVDRSDILGRSRRADRAAARHLVWWVLRESGWTWKKIGDEMGVDHTTVIGGVQKVIKKNLHAYYGLTVPKESKTQMEEELYTKSVVTGGEEADQLGMMRKVAKLRADSSMNPERYSTCNVRVDGRQESREYSFYHDYRDGKWVWKQVDERKVFRGMP